MRPNPIKVWFDDEVWEPISPDAKGLIREMLERDPVARITARQVRSGSLAFSRRTTVHPLHTRFSKRFGTSVSETTMRPNPKVLQHDWCAKRGREAGNALLSGPSRGV